MAVCGDGVRARAEGCDDGNRVSGDGCSDSCALEPGFTCAAEGGCRTLCGDGIAAGGEACDDGNTLTGDGCTPACAREPVIGTLQPVTGADPSALVTSNEVVINAAPGTLVTASALGRFDERVLVDGAERGVSARVAAGDRVALRMRAPEGFVANRSTALLVEGARLDWRISTRTSTHGWRVGEFGPCSASCGEGVRVRRVDCVDELGRVVDDARCDPPIPPGAESCTDRSGCSYAYGPWTPWSACMNGRRTRRRPCVREDGVEVACRFCGGACSGESACDVECARLGGAVVTCAPQPPGDQQACDEALARAVARCRDAGCALAPDADTTCSVGGFSGVPQCFGGRATCE
jgi:cysteine-rich repeat protein